MTFLFICLCIFYVECYCFLGNSTNAVLYTALSYGCFPSFGQFAPKQLAIISTQNIAFDELTSRYNCENGRRKRGVNFGFSRYRWKCAETSVEATEPGSSSNPELFRFAQELPGETERLFRHGKVPESQDHGQDICRGHR